MSTTVLGSYTFLETPDVNGNVILVNDGTVPILAAGELPAANFPILTGDITTTGGSLATTLATVNSNVGTFLASTVNAKGLVTAGTNMAVTGDVTGTSSGANVALTLATVNSNVGSFGSASVVPVVTVNAKGLVTAVSTANILGSIAQGLLSARPAAGSAGTLYLATDVLRIYRDNGTAWQIIADGNSDVIYQSLNSSIAAQSGTTYKAVSNVVPLSTDGTQIWSQTITPLFATSRISISGGTYVDHSVSGRKMTFAIFRGTTCIAVACDYVATTVKGVNLAFTVVDTPATTAATTYSIRCFSDGTTGTWYVSQGATALYGGALANQDITMREIA